MNKEAALAKLGLTGAEDVATVARVYGQRLTALQRQAATAQSDSERTSHQTQIHELVEAYELVTGAPNDATATELRSADSMMAANDTFARIEPGVVLADRLVIGEMLGAGGMGRVYAARDRLKDEDVAIKFLRQDLSFSAAAKDRFLAEARVSCSLSHPNIVRVHDVGMSGDVYYLSMERLKGCTLRHRIEAYRRDNRDFTLAEVNDIARQLIDALRYAHRYIVHRDLKPENIWLAEDGSVKLMDFGIARALTASQLTQTGVTLGTAYYMAPEQRAAAKDVDWRADQYALGVVLYELLAGTLPTGATKPLDAMRRDLPKGYSDAVMRAMASKPQDRFQSLDELWARLNVPIRSSRVAWVAGLAAACVAIGAGAFVFLGRPTEKPVETALAVETASERPSAPSALPDEPAPEAAAAQSIADGMPPAAAGVAALAEPEQEPPVVATSDAAAAGSNRSKNESGSGPLVEPQKPAAVAAASARDDRRAECIRQCERDDGECRSLNRRGRQDCMRTVGFNSTGRLTTGNTAALSCAFYGERRCEYAYNREACIARITDRHRLCMEVIGGSVAARRQDCEDKSRESDRMCMDELRDCRASC